MKKRDILFILLMMLCLFSAPAWAETEGDFVYSVIDGKATITAYNGAAPELTLPDTLGGYPVSAIGYCALRGCTALAQVVICEGVTSIGSNAFQNCLSLRQVSLPDSLAAIGSHAFYGCPELKQITLPDGIERLHPYAFYGCSAVRYCPLDSPAAYVLTDYGYSFTSPDFPLLTLKAFEDDAGVRTFTVADCDESAVAVSFPDGVCEIGGYAFYHCSSLTEVTLPDGVAKIAYSAFEGCSALRRITIRASVTTIDSSAFSGCADVTIIAPAGSVAQTIAEAHKADGFIWQAP